MRVTATREGLLGATLASGVVNTIYLPFVALPSTKALYRFVRVVNVANGQAAVAIVLDVGPWNAHDDAYVFAGARPASEGGVDTRGRTTNGAGIDLSEAIWGALAMTDNGPVLWEFVT